MNMLSEVNKKNLNSLRTSFTIKRVPLFPPVLKIVSILELQIKDSVSAVRY